ncbi:Glucans biosynthesis protein C [Anaerolineae bacterium]|nr:Glucans biosynthesis protein C [Anaerolineae bacterium]
MIGPAADDGARTVGYNNVIFRPMGVIMTSTTAVSQRRYDFDWLRILAIAAVFIFHTGRAFDQGGWHIKNAVTTQGMSIWTQFMVLWLMPIIFIVSGVSVYFTADKKPGVLIKDKVLRLLVPLVVGAFSHVALQVYIEHVTQHGFTGSFFDFIPDYFQGFYGLGGNFAWMGLHLWYLLVLFIFSIILLPLFRWFKVSASGQRFVSRFTDFLSKGLNVYLLALPIGLLLIALDPDGLGLKDFGGWSVFIYLFFFVYGYLIVASERLQASVKRWRGLSLVIGLAGVGGLLYGIRNGDPNFGTPDFAVLMVVYALCAWGWLLAILGFGMKHLNRPSPRLSALNEAVLPFYVMHQTVIVIMDYFILPLPIPDPLKFIIVGVSAFTIIVTLYELIVKRVGVLRFLFGMKPFRTASIRALKTVEV